MTWALSFGCSILGNDGPGIVTTGGWTGLHISGDAIITMHNMGYDLTDKSQLKKGKKDKENIKAKYNRLIQEKPELFGIMNSLNENNSSEKSIESVFNYNRTNKSEFTEKEKKDAFNYVRSLKWLSSNEILSHWDDDGFEKEIKPYLFTIIICAYRILEEAGVDWHLSNKLKEKFDSLPWQSWEKYFIPTLEGWHKEGKIGLIEYGPNKGNYSDLGLTRTENIIWEENYNNVLEILRKHSGKKITVSDIAKMADMDKDDTLIVCELLFKDEKIQFSGNGRYYIEGSDIEKQSDNKKSEEIDIKSELKKFKEMLDEDLITQEIYDAKAKELLGL